MVPESRDFFNYWIKTFCLVKTHWLRLTGIGGVLLLPVYVVDQTLGYILPGLYNDYFRHSWITPAMIDAIILCAAGAYFIANLMALMKYVAAADAGQTASLPDAYRNALNNFGAYLWMKILYLTRVLLWTLLFIIPGIRAAVWYGFSSLALMVDGLHGQQALDYSKKIVQNHLKKYLFNTIAVSLLLTFFCWFSVVNLDSLVVLFSLQGHPLLAEMVVVIELCLFLCSGIFWWIFYYYLYLEMKEELKVF